MAKKNKKPDTPYPVLIKLPFPTDEEILEIIRKYRCLVAHMICESKYCYEDATLVAVAIYRHIKKLPHDFDTYIWDGYDLAEDLKNPGREIMLQVGADKLNRAFQNRHKHRRAQMIYQLTQMNIQDVLDHGVESDQFYEEFSEPVYNLFRISAAKASTTICRLVSSFLSQFFQSRRHFSSQAKDRSTTHRFGSTTKVCISLRFTTSRMDRRSQQALHPSGKGLPSVTPVHQHILHQAEAVPPLVKHRQSPSPVGDVRGGHVDRMGQPLSIHRDVAFDSRHLLPSVIALLLGAVRVLDALGVHDAEAGLLFPTIASPGCANPFFLKLAPEWTLAPGQAARSIAGNTCSRCPNWGSPQGASATGTRFSKDRAPRRKHHTSPRCGAWYGGVPTPTWEESGQIAPG